MHATDDDMWMVPATGRRWLTAVRRAAATPVKWFGASHLAEESDEVGGPKHRIGGSADRAGAVRVIYVDGR